jgi:CHRD domain
MHIRSILLTSVLLLVSANSRAAEVYVADLVPVRANSDGSGVATFTILDDLSAIDYVVTYQNLTSPEVAAHVHHADGTIAFDLGIGNPKTGQWQAPLATNIVDFRNEDMYVNIHTEVYPLGELRGTLRRVVVPVAPSTWGAIKALYR